MAETASKAAIDFTNVKEGGVHSKKRQPEGDYRAKVTKVVDAPAPDGIKQWLFTIVVNGHTYPYYCKHQENQYWKIRNLLIAAGKVVPKKRVNVDPNVLVNKSIAVTLQDAEYEGKAQSEIAATFPLSELNDDDVPDEDENDVEEDDEDEAPAPVKKKKPAPVEEDDEDEDEDDEPAPPPKKKKAPAPVEEDDDEDEDDTPPPPKKKKKPAPVEDDDDLEEIDIDDA